MKKFLLAFAILVSLSAPAYVLGASDTGGGGPQSVTGTQPQSVTGTQGNAAQQTPPSPASNFQLQNPLGFSTICGLIKGLLNAVLTLGVPIAVFFLVFAGFKFVVARGSPDGIKKARENIVNVFIGIAIFLGAWFLGQVIANTLNSVTGGAVSGINSCN